MRMTKDQAKLELTRSALIALRENEEDASLTRLFTTDSGDPIIKSQANMREWQRVVMERLVEIGLIEKRRIGKSNYFTVIDGGRLVRIVEEIELDENGFVKWLVFPSDYPKPEVALRDGEWEESEEEERDEPSGRKVTMTELLSELENDETHRRALGSILGHVLLSQRDIIESMEKTNGSMEKMSEFTTQIGQTSIGAFGELKAAQDRISSRLRSMEERLDRMEEKVGRTDKRVRVVPEMKEKLDSFTESFAVFNAALTAEIRGVRESVLSSVEAMRDTGRRVDTALRMTAIAGQMKTWMDVFRGIENQSKDALAGVEAVVDAVGKLEADNGPT